MIVVTKAKAAWSEQRQCWRLDIQYQDPEGSPKRTFIVVPAAGDKTTGAGAAERAARDFRRAIGPLYANFYAKFDAARPAPTPRAQRSPMKAAPKRQPTIAWLLDQCLEHPEVWGKVKHSKNYVSGAKKLNAIVGDRLVSEFEPPHGRKLVLDVVAKLRSEGFSDGYVRKIAYQLRQALCACVGQGVTEAIVDPDSLQPLINDIPTFPALAKSKGRTAVLEREHDEIVFQIIRQRFGQAREEERAFAEKINAKHLLGQGAHGRVEIADKVVWLNPRRFSSRQWMTFERYIRFLIESGCRRSEALSVGNHSIRYREVTGDDGSMTERFAVLHIPAEVSKNGIERFVNLTPTLIKALPLWQRFAEPHSFKIGDRVVERQSAWFPLQPSQVTGMWEHVRSDAKRLHAVDLSKVSPHQLRHTHATRMSERGLSGKALSDSLGHQDERTTRIYDHAQSVDRSRRFFARNVSG